MTFAAEPSTTLPAGPFVGRRSFAEHIGRALLQAAHAGWPQLILSDADFADWPLAEPLVLQALTDWARTRRQLTLLAVHYDEVHRRFPRFVRWRQRYAHCIQAHAVDAEHAGDVPSALWSPQWALLRHNPRQSRGACGSDGQRIQLVRGLLDDWLARSQPAFAADVLGL